MKSHAKRILLPALVVAAVKGTIEGDDFAKALLAIWLGGDPPNPEIKAGMLGGACG